MCTTPQVAQQHWSREKILTVMETTRLLQLPVVDADGRVIGLETLHELLDRKHIDNPVFLMAGGFGTRLYPLLEQRYGDFIVRPQHEPLHGAVILAKQTMAA